ncbi:DUF308 domain-containing protein [Ornithinimicrobium sp. W1679]|uniref:DUF308 domain-containing protein n=1 Tax=Ornithinimicrobium sp. W1679 TaxID=3418770 RepID=UPI003CECC2AE
MSYDILLYPRQPGQTWEQVVEADEQDGPEGTQADLDAGLAVFRRIEARLREQLTEPVDTWVAEELGGDVYGELTGLDSGLQVELYDRSASVAFPYGGDTERGELHESARHAVRIVAEETGYEAYDPQRGRTFDGLFDDEAGHAEADRLAAEGGSDPAGTGPEDDEGYGAASAGATVAGAGAGVGAGADGGGGTAGRDLADDMDADADINAADDAGAQDPDGTPARPDPRQNPKTLRRRAYLYLGIGALLTVLGVFRMTSGDGGLLTWFILGIGVIDLLGGVMMLSLAKQMEQGADLRLPGGLRPSGEGGDDAGGPRG